VKGNTYVIILYFASVISIYLMHPAIGHVTSTRTIFLSCPALDTPRDKHEYLFALKKKSRKFFNCD
jgi:hypothetical protein